LCGKQERKPYMKSKKEGKLKMKNMVDEAIHARILKNIYGTLVHTILGLKTNSEKPAHNIGSNDNKQTGKPKTD
jgi:hypothetical protein